MAQIQKDDGILTSGKTYFIPDGSNKAYDIGNVTAYTFETSSETKDRISRQTGSYGQALDAVTLPGATVASLTFDTFNRFNLAMALMGADVDLNEVGATIADQSIVVAELDRMTVIGKRNIDAATFTVKDANNAAVPASLVSLNPALGYFSIAAGGTVKAGDTVKVSFQTLTRKGYLINAATVQAIRGKIEVHGVNQVNGQKMFITAGNVTLAADGSFDWMGDDFIGATLTGTAAVDDTTGAPYTIEVLDV